MSKLKYIANGEVHKVEAPRTGKAVELKPSQQEQTAIKEFQSDAESKTIAYFIDKLDRVEYPPLDVRQFYKTKAINSLSQIGDPNNIEDLVCLVSFSDKIH